MKIFAAIAIIFFGLLTNINAAYQDLTIVPEREIIALQNELTHIFPEGDAARQILENSFRQIFELSSIELDNETRVTEVAKIIQQTAKDLLRQGTNIQELRAFAQTPIANQFGNALVEKYEELVAQNRAPRIKMKTCLHSLDATLQISVLLVLVALIIMLEYALQFYHTEEECVAHRGMVESCPCYDFRMALLAQNQDGPTNLKLMGQCMGHLITELLAGHNCSCI